MIILFNIISNIITTWHAYTFALLAVSTHAMVKLLSANATGEQHVPTKLSYYDIAGYLQAFGGAINGVSLMII